MNIHTILTHHRIMGILVPTLGVFAFAYITMAVNWNMGYPLNMLPSILWLLGLSLPILGGYLYRSWWGMLVIPPVLTIAAFAAALIALIPQGEYDWSKPPELDLLVAMVTIPGILGTAIGIGLSLAGASRNRKKARV